MGEYINIYGLLFAKTADGKLAFTGQIWDETLQKFQSDINANTPQLGEDGKLPINLLPESLQNATSSEVVASLPETGEANKIYLVKREGSDPVVYDPSMWIDGAWASFGGSGGGENNALVFDQEQTLTAKQQNQVLANAGLNIIKIPSALFGTVLSDEDFAAIQNATAIIPIDGNQAGFIFTKAIITPVAIDFFSFNTNFSFRRATLTISDKRLSILAATDIKDQVAVKYERQTLTPQQMSIARSNIGTIDAETVNGLLQVVAPTYVGVGGDDLSQYDIADDSPMYVFLVRLIAFMGTIDETSPVFWFYSEDNANSPTQQFGTVVAWSNEEMTFIAMRPDGSISEYQIVGGETGIPTALNRLRTANVFIPQGAVLFSQAQSLADSQKLQARNNIGAASQADVDEINQILFTQYTALTMSRTPASFEKGIETAVTLNWSTKFNNQEITPDSIEVKKGSTVLTTDKTLKTIGDNVSDTQAYSMTAVIKGITKTASVTVNAYYPMYFARRPRTLWFRLTYWR